ncbi:MAG: hypothetical protein DRJ40_02335 [Thermoprotei archaeon]|nr:MAG: hypothetical protein DRJ40_02335 [Thermoprotei archaeon]
MGYTIVLTSDRATMTDYSGADWLGFLLCLPHRLVPRPVMYNVLAPKLKVDEEYRALTPPYPLRKIEAALLAAGFKESEVIITTPEYLHKVITDDTEVVGVHVLDPLGKAPVSYTLASLAGGGETCTQYLFMKLMNKLRKLKHRYRFKIIVGGPGTWQLKEVYTKIGIDALIHGEGELLFPEICKKVLSGEEISGEFYAPTVPVDKIPTIRGPSRNGLVQITRGCPRRCAFCNPTMFDFRSIPLPQILREVEVNVRAGIRGIGLVTEDGFLYGANGIRVNVDAVKRLVDSIAKLTRNVGFCHVSISSILQAPNLVKYITEVWEYSEDKPYIPQVGIETGSPKLISIHMGGKPRPWTPDDWPWMCVEATKIMNDNCWYPCYTMILGLPGEEESDVVATVELVDELKGTKCWLFPLLMVPMGLSRLEREKFFTLNFFTDTHWELLARCIEHDISFTNWILPRLLDRLSSGVARKLVERFINLGLKTMKDVVQLIRSNPEKLIEEASKVDVNVPSPRILLNLVWLLIRR